MCAVYASLESETPEATIGFQGGRMVADVETYRRAAPADGECPLVWRQGIKHDAAALMELRGDGEFWINKLGEAVDVEAEFVYPLLTKAPTSYKATAPIPRPFAHRSAAARRAGNRVAASARAQTVALPPSARAAVRAPQIVDLRGATAVRYLRCRRLLVRRPTKSRSQA